MTEPKLFVAAKAFIVHNGKVLLIRESNKYEDGTQAGKFGEVGGRLKPGERFDESLLRETKEETGLDVTIGKPFYVGDWWPKVHGEQWQIVGIFFECHATSPEVILSADHDAYEWINPKEYQKYEIMEDLHPVFVEYLKQYKEV